MNRNQLEYFVKLAAKQSFHAAANELFISAPALQQQINALEAEVGAKLLTRGPKGVRLTEEGGRFYSGALGLLHQMDELLAFTRDESPEASQIRLGVRAGLPLGFLGELCLDFRASRPRVRVIPVSCSVTVSASLEELSHGLFDVCLCADYQRDIAAAHGLAFTLLFESPMCVLVSPHDPLAHHEEGIAVSDLVGRVVNVLDYTGFVRSGQIPASSEGICYHIQPFTVSNAYAAALNNEVTISTMAQVPYFYPLVGVPLVDMKVNGFGLAHRPDPSPTVASFVAYAREWAAGR